MIYGNWLQSNKSRVGVAWNDQSERLISSREFYIYFYFCFGNQYSFKSIDTTVRWHCQDNCECACEAKKLMRIKEIIE